MAGPLTNIAKPWHSFPVLHLRYVLSHKRESWSSQTLMNTTKEAFRSCYLTQLRPGAISQPEHAFSYVSPLSGTESIVRARGDLSSTVQNTITFSFASRGRTMRGRKEVNHRRTLETNRVVCNWISESLSEHHSPLCVDTVKWQKITCRCESFEKV